MNRNKTLVVCVLVVAVLVGGGYVWKRHVDKVALHELTVKHNAEIAKMAAERVKFQADQVAFNAHIKDLKDDAAKARADEADWKSKQDAETQRINDHTEVERLKLGMLPKAQ